MGRAKKSGVCFLLFSAVWTFWDILPETFTSLLYVLRAKPWFAENKKSKTTTWWSLPSIYLYSFPIRMSRIFWLFCSPTGKKFAIINLKGRQPSNWSPKAYLFPIRAGLSPIPNDLPVFLIFLKLEMFPNLWKKIGSTCPMVLSRHTNQKSQNFHDALHLPKKL